MPEAIALTHRFPAYRFEVGGALGAPIEVHRIRDDERGDYVHSLHAQALAERVILARAALRQGRTGKANEILEEAFAYLNKPHHTR